MTNDTLRLSKLLFILGKTSALLYDLNQSFKFTPEQKRLLNDIERSIEEVVYKNENPELLEAK